MIILTEDERMENELFEKTPVPKAYFTFALPVVFSMVVSLVYNMVDTYFIAQTGNTNLVAGVSLSAPVFTLMIALGDIFGLGGSSLISRLFGEKKDEDGKRLSVFCFYAAIVCGILVTAVMMMLREPILYVLGADAETFTYASGYYTYIVLGAPFIILSFTPSNLLRTEGFATASMTGSILGAAVNMILDPVFISVLGFGAAGAAIATVIGNIFADIFYVWFLLKRSRRLSINPVGFHIHIVEVGQILAIGIPASITNLMQSIGIALTNRSLLPYGNDKVAAMGIVMKVNLIAVLVLVGFAFGAQPLVGYNYGAKNHARLKEILRFSYGSALPCGARHDRDVYAGCGYHRGRCPHAPYAADGNGVYGGCACDDLYFPVGRKSGGRFSSVGQQTGGAFCSRSLHRLQSVRLPGSPDGTGGLRSADGGHGGYSV